LNLFIFINTDSTNSINVSTTTGTLVTMNLLTGAAASVLNVGSTTMGNITFTQASGSTFAIIGSGGTVNLASDVANNTVTLANGQSGGSLSIAAAMTTGSIAIGSAQTSGTFSLGSTGANIGLVTLFGGTGAQIINFANSTGGKTLSIATGAAANQVTIGSTNTTSTTTINAGTGGLKLTGGQVLPVTSVNHAASPYTVLGTDQVIAVDPTAGVVTINLPNAPAAGRYLVIYDATGQAAAHTITITTPGGSTTISSGGTSATSKTLTTAFQSINLYANTTSNYMGQIIT
jgi:WD40 repeat protein